MCVTMDPGMKKVIFTGKLNSSKSNYSQFTICKCEISPGGILLPKFYMDLLANP